MILSTPLISCLCVTRGKPVLLQRALNCFMAQTYENKELIIVYEDDDVLTANWLLKINDENVKKVKVKKTAKINLGELRNIAIKNATGQFVCQWDDDDWYHIGRLEYQFEVIKSTGTIGSIMTKWIVFDTTTQKAYLSNQRLWEGSILCKKSVITEKMYENQKMGEDTAVINYLFSSKKIAIIDNAPNLYIYVYHGMNTWDYDHWSLVFKMSHELSIKDSQKIKDLLDSDSSITDSSVILDNIINNPIFEEYE